MSSLSLLVLWNIVLRIPIEEIVLIAELVPWPEMLDYKGTIIGRCPKMNLINKVEEHPCIMLEDYMSTPEFLKYL